MDLSRLQWDLVDGAGPALLAAVLAGLLAGALASRRVGRRAFGVAAATARGLAVAALVLVMLGPFVVDAEPTPGALVGAAHDETTGVTDDAFDTIVRWPSDAPTPAAALEAARAARPPARATIIALDASGIDDAEAALSRALRPLGSRATQVIGATPPVDAERRAIAPLPLTVDAPASATAGIPVVLSLDGGQVPFDGSDAKLIVGTREIVVPLPSGKRRVNTPPLALPRGTHLIRISSPERRPAVTFVDVADAPRVLVISALPADEVPVTARFRAQGLPTEQWPASLVTDERLAGADVVVLAADLSRPDLERRVRAHVEQGAGLIVLGGPDDRGLGRLRDGPLADVLPARLPAPPRELPPELPPETPDPQPPEPEPPTPDPEQPETALQDGEHDALRIALLLVIDRSGSMEGPKMSRTRTAARLAARSLGDDDRVGVIAFDDHADWIVPFQDAGDRASLDRRIAALRARGGTDIYPALEEGIAAIVKQDCGIRHVILLSDGSTRGAVFKDLIEGGARKGVTLSTVAVGDGADTRLLGLMAGWGKGRLHLADDPDRLPEIVTLDARRFTTDERQRRDEQVENLPTPPPDTTADAPSEESTTTEPAPEPPEPSEPEPAPRARPNIADSSAALTGLEEATWPEIAWPESVVARPGSHVPLRWSEGGVAAGEPALVIGRTGAGRVAVFACDASTRESSALWEWDQSGRFLAQLVRGMTGAQRGGPGGEIARATNVAGGRQRVTVRATAAGAFDIWHAGAQRRFLAVHDVDSGGAEALLDEPLAPGVWSGSYTPHRGDPVRVALVVDAPPAARATSVVEAARAAGARLVDTVPARPDGGGDTEGEPRRPLDAVLLLGAAACVLVEAALRRQT